MTAVANKNVQGYYSVPNPGIKTALKKRENLASVKVIEGIRNALFSDELKAGDFLGRESDLVKHFNVSRVPMRDALRTLEAMGIVEIRVGGKGGIYIAKGDPLIFAEALAIQHKLLGINYNEMIDIHIALENMALELAIKNASDEELDQLSAIVKKLAKHTDDQNAFTPIAQEFHNAIARTSGNRAINSQMTVFVEMLFKYYIPAVHLTNAGGKIDTRSEVLKHNRRLIRLLKKRDTNATQLQVRKHWNRMRQFFH